LTKSYFLNQLANIIIIIIIIITQPQNCRLPEDGSTLKIFEETLFSDLLSSVMRNLEFSAKKISAIVRFCQELV